MNERSDIMKYAYEYFIQECLIYNLYTKIIDAAKKNRSRINLLIFDVKDKIPNTEIPYCAVLQGTHKTEDENALYNYWVRTFKNSSFIPILTEIDNRLKITEMGYKIHIYKFWLKKWAIELEWETDKDHMEKINYYLQKYGNPY
jgi:hypothetical protein